jgi:hypothetical protein
MADKVGYTGALDANGVPIPELFTDNGDGTWGRLTALAAGRVVAGGTTHFSLPGVEMTNVGTAVISAGVVRYAPILVETAITIDQLAIEVTAAGAANTTARLGIYRAGLDWQPTDLVVDAGTVAVDSTGVKTAAVDTTLLPGRYLLAVNSDGTPTLRTARGGSRYTGAIATLGASLVLGALTASQSYAAFPSSGTAYGVAGATLGAIHYIWLRVSVP